MAKFIFTCSQCGQSIEGDDADAGCQINCPTCQADIIVPALTPQEGARNRGRGGVLTALISFTVLVVCAGWGFGGWYFYSHREAAQTAVRVSPSPADTDVPNGTTRAQSAAAGLQIHSDFPGGSARVLNLDPVSNTVRITPAGDPNRGWPCWWYFRLDNADTNRPLQLEVVANQAVVQGDKPGQARKLPANWSLPDRAVFSTDGTNWQHTEKGERRGNHTVYQISTTAPTVWLAWGPPFTLREASQMIQDVCARSAYAKSFVLAQTRGGRPVPGVRISEPGATAGPRFSVWIQARQHAWESGSSWVARGFAEWLVSEAPAAESLRRKADIVIVPIVDVDSVELGQGGKDAMPHDQNRDWGTDVYYPEVRAAMERLSSLARAGQLDLLVDLHNPSFNDHVIDFYIPPAVLQLPQRQRNEDNFFKIVGEQMTDPFPYTGKIAPNGETYDPAVNKAVDAWTAAQSPPYVVACTMEVPWNIPAGTPSGYLDVGARLGGCIDLYLQPAIRSGSVK